MQAKSGFLTPEKLYVIQNVITVISKKKNCTITGSALQRLMFLKW
jgi:hypothetical protein